MLGLRQGVQFLSIGGASEVGWLSVPKLQEFTAKNIEAVKLAGFHGICFDVELTKGEQDLVRAFNRAFKKMRGVSPAAYAKSGVETAQA